MLAFCRETGPRPRHFFYGGAPGVAEDLARQLHERFNITVAGTYTPPFRPLTEAEEEDLTAQVPGRRSRCSLGGPQHSETGALDVRPSFKTEVPADYWEWVRRST